jgi:hypothetical protein
MQRASIVRLPAGLLALVVVAGSAGLFATFWDDAWHTELGRDQATIPPHLLLYGSMAVIGAVVAAWGLVALRRSRSPAAVLRQPPLLLAAAGGTLTLVALPIDAAWHAAFGRDAVLWSPPHMLAIFGSLALLVGFLAGARPDTPAWILTGLGALLLGSAAVPVLEFETDVPQFSETLYLPVLLAATLFAAMLLRHVLPGPLPVARAVGVYALLRVAITLGLASVDAGAVAVVAVPALLMFLAVLPTQLRRSSLIHGRALLLVAVAVALASSPSPADAHDPGQGRPIAPVTLTGTSYGRGTITITADSDNDCAMLPPRRVVARRAGPDRHRRPDRHRPLPLRRAGPRAGHRPLVPLRRAAPAGLRGRGVAAGGRQQPQPPGPAPPAVPAGRPGARRWTPKQRGRRRDRAVRPGRVAAGADRRPGSRPCPHAAVAVTGDRVARSTTPA